MAKHKPEIEVHTESHFLSDQSSSESRRFIWSYDITIVNKSAEIIQLLSRYWKITDINGKVEEVKGPGVIGLQPIIKPGKQFAYSSFCQLSTPQGTMEGHYEIQNLDEECFTIEIPKLILKGSSASSSHMRSSLH